MQKFKTGDRVQFVRNYQPPFCRGILAAKGELATVIRATQTGPQGAIPSGGWIYVVRCDRDNKELGSVPQIELDHAP